jgi:hypothetical protein
MKELFKTPLLSLAMLLLASGAWICMEWKSPWVIFMVPFFLFFLLFFVVVLRLRLQKRHQLGVVITHAKAGHVS